MSAYERAGSTSLPLVRLFGAATEVALADVLFERCGQRDARLGRLRGRIDAALYLAHQALGRRRASLRPILSTLSIFILTVRTWRPFRLTSPCTA